MRVLALLMPGLVLGCGCTLFFGEPSPSSTVDAAAADASGDGNLTDPSLPRLGPVSPAPGAFDVVPVIAVRAEFTKVVHVDASSFLVRRNGTSVPGTVRFDAPTLTATFLPNAPLIPFATYEAAITRDVVDLEGKALATETRWTFTIKEKTDVTAPIIGALSPDIDATMADPRLPVIAEFNEAMGGPANSIALTTGATPVPGHVHYAVAPARAIFIPDRQLAASTLYTVTLFPALTDLEGNTFAGAPVTWSFTTMPDTTPPHAFGITPMSGSTDVGTTPLISVTFDEPVVGVDATTFTLTPESGGGAVAAAVTYDAGSNTAVLHPTQPLISPGAYFGRLLPGITDTVGNVLPREVWRFETSFYTGCY